MAILSDDEVREALAGRAGWRRSGDTLVRERAHRDFGEALAFLGRIGEAVEDYGRHPDVAIMGGNRVRVTVSNANGAGFTDAELRLVAKVDEVADAPKHQAEPPEAEPEPPRGPLVAVSASSATSSATSATAAEKPVQAAQAIADQTPRSPSRGTVIAAAAGGVAVGAAAVVAARRR